MQHFLSSLRPCDVTQGTVTSHREPHHARSCDITERNRRLWQQTTVASQKETDDCDFKKQTTLTPQKETDESEKPQKGTDDCDIKKQTTLTPQKERVDSEKTQKETDDCDITETDDCN